MSDREFSTSNGPEIGEQREYCKLTGLKQPDFAKGEDETSFVCRIMPAFGSCSASNKRMLYHSVHYGYSGVNSRNPANPRKRPFFCIEKIDFDTKKVLVACPECEMIAERNEVLKKMTLECEKKDMTKEETYKTTEAVFNWLKEHRADRKWYINVYGIDNKFYTLKINNTLKRDTLMPLLDKITNVRKIDPYAFDQGVWLNFTRRGTHTDNVNLVMETVTKEDETFEKPKKAPLTPETVSRAKEILNDLKFDLFPTLSADQIRKLAKSSGDPEEVDAIFNIPTNNSSPVTVSNSADLISSPAVSMVNKRAVKAETVKVQNKIQDIVNNPVQEEDPAEAFYNKIK